MREQVIQDCNPWPCDSDHSSAAGLRVTHRGRPLAGGAASAVRRGYALAAEGTHRKRGITLWLPSRRDLIKNSFLWKSVTIDDECKLSPPPRARKTRPEETTR